MEACLRHEIRKIKKKVIVPFYLTVRTFSPQKCEFIALNSDFITWNCEFTYYNSEREKSPNCNSEEKSSYFFIPWWKQEYHDNNSYKLAHSTAFKTNLITTKNNFVLLFVFEVTMSSYIIFANFVCCCWVFFHTKMLSFSPKHCC